MNAKIAAMIGVAAVMLAAGWAMADTFGTGANQFTIDFVPISGSTNPTSGIPVDSFFTFTGVASDYRMGTYEITNDQWNKFQAAYGTVTGADGGYSCSPQFPGSNVPVNKVSWYEAAQFVNWLNTSTGHQAAYKFTGTQGTSNYTFGIWSDAEAAWTDLYRNKNAFYYLPTENEWMKTGYWNGTSLQDYATKAGDSLPEAVATGTGWNYNSATNPPGPWAVGSGSQELNGTYDMMGNIEEWMETPYFYGDYGTDFNRGLRGGSWASWGHYLASTWRDNYTPYTEYNIYGFRVASEVPEPATLSLVALGGLAMLRGRRVRA